MNSIEDLYNKSKQENSPVALDNLILNAAKQSCKSSAMNSKRKKWLYALPTAAVVILSFSLILNLQSVNQEMITLPEQSFVSGNDNKASKTIKKQGKTNGHMDVQAVRVPIAEKKDSTEKLKKRRMDFSVNPSFPTKELNDNLILPKAIPKPNKPLSQEESVVGRIKPSAQSADLERGFEFDEKSSYSSLEAEQPVDTIISDTINEIGIENKPSVKRVMAAKIALSKDANKTDFLQTEIEKIKRLIEQNELERANILLKSLKKKYPNVDFSELLIIPKNE